MFDNHSEHWATLLNDATFETPVSTHVPECSEHGADCLGHAIRVTR